MSSEPSSKSSPPEPSVTRLLDLRGLKCPLPALRTKKALKEAAIGDLFIVECTDPLAVIDIPHLVHETGNTLVQQAAADGLYIFHIKRTQQ
jgi:tRNA 2-thiouridine synthesizing protein A